ncbi:MAG: hypothetical protein ACTMIL_11850 [Brevibacterium aurantiacum]
MSDFTTFSDNETWALRRLVNIGIHDFEIQVSGDPRMMDHLEMPLADYRAMHAGITAKLAANTTIDARLFDRDETQFISHLAQVSIDLGGTSPDDRAAQDAEEWESRIVAKAHHMNEERRSTDFSPTADGPAEPSVSRPDGVYNRATLEAAGHRLEVGDWDAHRKLAQIAVESGYAAEVTQDYINDTAEKHPLQHSIRILEANEIQPRDVDSAGLSTEFDPMGGTREVEQFTPEKPHGDYGRQTPFDVAPINADEPGFPQPSNAHIDALATQPPSPAVQSSLTLD